MKSRLLGRHLAIIWLMLASYTCFGSIYMIAKKDSKLEKVSKSQVKKLFLGKSKKIKGVKVQALNLPEDTEDYQKFSKSILRKNKKQLTQYWARRIFTGKGTPPKTIDSAEDIVDMEGEVLTYTMEEPSEDVKTVGKL